MNRDWMSFCEKLKTESASKWIGESWAFSFFAIRNYCGWFCGIFSLEYNWTWRRDLPRRAMLQRHQWASKAFSPVFLISFSFLSFISFGISTGETTPKTSLLIEGVITEEVPGDALCCSSSSAQCVPSNGSCAVDGDDSTIWTLSHGTTRASLTIQLKLPALVRDSVAGHYHRRLTIENYEGIFNGGKIHIIRNVNRNHSQSGLRSRAFIVCWILRTEEKWRLKVEKYGPD